MYKTHVSSGIGLGLLIYRLIFGSLSIAVIQGGNLERFIIYMIFVVFGSVAPDLDLPQSKVAGKITGVNSMKNFRKKLKDLIWISVFFMAIAFFMEKTRAFNLLSYLFLFEVILYMAFENKKIHMLRQFVMILMSGLAFFMYYKLNYFSGLLVAISILGYIYSRHRGLSHCLIFNLYIAYSIHYSFFELNAGENARIATLGFLVGFVIHIYINDLFTNNGVPSILYPLNIWLFLIIDCFRKGRFMLTGKEFRKRERKSGINYRIPLFTTGSKFEYLISLAMIAIGFINILE